MIGHLLTTTLTVLRPRATTDDVGGQVVELLEVGELRAQVAQPTAAEVTAAAAVGAKLASVVHVRASDDVARGDYLDGAPGGERLRVLGVVVPSRRAYKRLECEAVQAGG